MSCPICEEAGSVCWECARKVAVFTENHFGGEVGPDMIAIDEAAATANARLTPLALALDKLFTTHPDNWEAFKMAEMAVLAEWKKLRATGHT